MKKIVVTFLVVACLTSCTTSAVTPPFDLVDLLPVGEVRFEIMTFGLSETGIQLAERYQAAVTKHREWFAEQTGNRKPGEPLEYDERMGLTKDEYEKYMGEAKNMKIVSTGQVVKGNIVVENNVFRLEFRDSTPFSLIGIDWIHWRCMRPMACGERRMGHER